MSLYSELKRRNVFRVAVLYAAASWVLLQVGDLLFGALGVPAWGIRLLLGLLLLGFPLALIFAWVYEITPEGLKLEQGIPAHRSSTGRTARKINVLAAALVVIAIAIFGVDRHLNHREAATAGTTPVTATTAPTANAPLQSASIAVLPFVNMSEDKSNEYFSDGLTEELLNVLANVPGLRVIARTSSFSYKGREVKIADVARELNVDHVLEGSVRKAGNKVRITTQLIRASDSSHVWSQTYDRTLDDVFKVQDEISDEVVDALKVRLLKGTAPSVEVGGTRIAAAYDAYLQGTYFKNQGYSEATLRKALAAFDEAIRLDPKFARAHVGRSTVLVALGSNGYEPFQSAFAAGQESANRAIELAPDLGESWVAKSVVRAFVDVDPKGSMRDAERAMQLNPGSFDVQNNYIGAALSLGRTDEAIAAARAAVDLDPLSAEAQITLSGMLIAARRYAEAETVARRALSLDPNRSHGHAHVGMALVGQRRYDEALREFEQERMDWSRDTGRALVYARTGRSQEARAVLEEMRRTMGDSASYQFAQIHAQLGDIESTFHWLQTAFRVHDPGLMSNVMTDPLLDPVRQDPRFKKLLRDLGYDPPQ